MSELPGNAGYPVLGDRSLEFYKDPVGFCDHRLEKHNSRVFRSRLLNKPTVLVCSVRGMREVLHDKDRPAKLQGKSLTACMKISINGPPVSKFNYSRALELFFAQPRRIACTDASCQLCRK